jgi:hypothetical protein
MSYPWGTNRRFNAYSDYFRREYGERVQKITINAGFTCPNRDGKVGWGGCTFCDNRAFNPSYKDAHTSVTEQIKKGMEFHKKRYRKAKRYLAYFQAFSNTYADLEHLQKLYQEALSVPEVMGIVVGTRPDCVDEEKLDYFAELATRCHLVLEYGLESMLNHTLIRVNRGHDVEKSRWAVEETARRGIHVGGHLILGLPGEQRSDYLRTARELADWPLDSVKFHQLQLIKGTSMAREFENKPEDFPSFTMEEYLDLMLEIVELLPPRLVIERIAGELTPGMGLRDGWGLRYDGVLKAFEKLQEEKDSWQGKKFIAMK